MNLDELISKIYKTLPEPMTTTTEATIELVGGASPFISSIMNFVKFKRINNELSNLEGKINSILHKIESNENDIFIKQEIFPIILNKIINEEQVEKISIIFNGFEHLIDKNIISTEKVFHYYDVLDEMRLSEIVHLTDKYVVPLVERENMNREIKLKRLRLQSDYTDEDYEVQDLERYMDNKLFRLGILEYVKERVRDENDEVDYTGTKTNYRYQFSSSRTKYQTNTDAYKLSNFGNRFIDFFYNE